jgi:porin
MSNFSKSKTMRKVSLILAVLVVCGFVSIRAGAEDAPAPTPYSGDFWSRSTLTGDWGGLRNDLAAKGVTLDMDITQVGQGVVGGGKSGAWQYGGRSDFILNLDSQKLGLWPGAYFNFEMEVNWASAVNKDSGALMPVNTNQTFPFPPGGIFGVPAWNFSQFLSPYFGLSLGKYATVTATSGDMNEFAHGKGDTQFMNMALNINPQIAFTVPYSTLGTGLIVLPTKDPKEAIASLFVMSANGKPQTSGFEDLNGNAIVVAGEGRLTTNFFGRTGHQLFGATFSNKTFTSIDQRLASIVELRSLRPEKGSWNIHYNFDQYLWEPKKRRGQGHRSFRKVRRC